MTHERRLLVIAFAALAAALGWIVVSGHHGSSSSTIHGSGTPTTETRTVPPFTGVELLGAATIRIETGSPQHVTVTADDNIVSHVTTTVTSGTLEIGMKNGSVSPKTGIVVAITVPSLDELNLTGAGTMTAKGTADSLAVSMAGAGTIDARDVVAKSVRASIAGAGTVIVHATEALDATVSGTGTIVYAGEPAHVTTSVSGTGSITRG